MTQPQIRDNSAEIPVVGGLDLALRWCTTTKDFEEVVKRLVERAKEGEEWAVKLYLAYTQGRPRVRQKYVAGVDVSGMETLNGCGLVLERIAEALAAQEISTEDAALYQGVVESRIRAHIAAQDRGGDADRHTRQYELVFQSIRDN